MLVLGRCEQESIIVGENVEITIVSIRGKRVSVGITAPKELSVHRKEIYEAVQHQKVIMNSQGDREQDKCHNFISKTYKHPLRRHAI